MKCPALKCLFWLEPYSYTSLPLCIRMTPSLVKGFCPLCGPFILSWLQSLQVKIPMIAKLLTVESDNKAIILIPVFVHYWRGRSQWNDGIKMVSELLEQLQMGGDSHCLMKKAFYISCQIMKSKAICKEDETWDGCGAHFKHHALKPASRNGNYKKDLAPSMLIRPEILT